MPTTLLSVWLAVSLSFYLSIYLWLPASNLRSCVHRVKILL